MNTKQKKEKFNQCYDQNFDRVFYYVLSRTSNADDAADITSEAFLGLWKAMDSYEQDKELVPYLFGILRHKLSDFLRIKYKLSIELSGVDWERVEPPQEVPDEDNTDRDEKVNLVKTLVKDLGKDDRQLYKLKYEDKLTNKEIADKLNIKLPAVKTRNYRMLKKLKELWMKKI